MEEKNVTDDKSKCCESKINLTHPDVGQRSLLVVAMRRMLWFEALFRGTVEINYKV